MAAAAPPHSASDWEMNGTSRMARGAGWASRRPASTAIRTIAPRLLVHRNDDENQHQQRDDDQRRGDDDTRLAAGEGTLNLSGLRRHTCEIVALQGRDRTGCTAQIDTRPLGNTLDL